MDIREKALKLELAKRFGEAAQLYRQIGNIEKASYMFQKAGQIDDAIELFASEKMFARAAELAVKAEKWTLAGELFEKSQNWQAATSAYAKAGRFDREAKIHEQIGEWEKAGAAYLKAGDPARAGGAFERAGNAKEAARAYVILADKSSSKTGSPQELKKIAKTLEAGGSWEKAGALYAETGDHISAIHMFSRANDVAEAAQLYLKHAKDRGYEVLSSIPTDGKIYKNYAAMFILAGEFPFAAQVWEHFGEYIKAGEMYEKINDDYMAADAFLKGLDYERAGMFYSRCGNYEKAAELFLQAENHFWAAESYEKAQMPFEAGNYYFKAEDYDNAIKMLQKTTDDDPRYFEASVMLCRAYRIKGFSDLALERYKKIMDAVSLSHDSIEFYYDVALLMRAKRNYERAESILRQIVDLNFGYKDSAKLLQEIQSLRLLTAPQPSEVARKAPTPPVQPEPPPFPQQKPAPLPPAEPKAEEKHAEAPEPKPTKTPEAEEPKKPQKQTSKNSFASWISSIKKDKN